MFRRRSKKRGAFSIEFLRGCQKRLGRKAYCFRKGMSMLLVIALISYDYLVILIEIGFSLC